MTFQLTTIYYVLALKKDICKKTPDIWQNKHFGEYRLKKFTEEYISLLPNQTTSQINMLLHLNEKNGHGHVSQNLYLLLL